MQVRSFFTVAFQALQNLSKSGGTTVFGFHPGPIGPGWIMPNMLSVSTLQLGDPVIQFILVKPGDSLLHAAGLAE